MPSRLLAFLLAVAPALAACEGVVCSEGVVADAVTGAPLEGAKAQVTNLGSESAVTDATGHYKVCSTLVGCVPDCPDLKVEFSRQGYATQQCTDPRDVRLEPL